MRWRYTGTPMMILSAFLERYRQNKLINIMEKFNFKVGDER
jgi:hypothetical protein